MYKFNFKKMRDGEATLGLPCSKTEALAFYHIKQECIPVGCVPYATADVSGGGGVSARGCRGCTPPPMNIITDRCKNITFPQLRLQMVIKAYFLKVVIDMI